MFLDRALKEADVSPQRSFLHFEHKACPVWKSEREIVTAPF